MFDPTGEMRCADLVEQLACAKRSRKTHLLRTATVRRRGWFRRWHRGDGGRCLARNTMRHSTPLWLQGEVVAPGRNRSQPRFGFSAISRPRGMNSCQRASSIARRTPLMTSWCDDGVATRARLTTGEVIRDLDYGWPPGFTT